MRAGQPDVVPMPAGQVVGRISEIRPVAAVMESLVAETDAALRRLGGLR
jgi:NAD(P)H-dependent flavin oxidoreductase YrpB (nitropropane dioxygenase family)